MERDEETSVGQEVGQGGADCVYESTGILLTKDTVRAIIDGGANEVFSSAPAKDDSQAVVIGVNTNR